MCFCFLVYARRIVTAYIFNIQFRITYGIITITVNLVPIVKELCIVLSEMLNVKV